VSCFLTHGVVLVAIVHLAKSLQWKDNMKSYVFFNRVSLSVIVHSENAPI